MLAITPAITVSARYTYNKKKQKFTHDLRSALLIKNKQTDLSDAFMAFGNCNDESIITRSWLAYMN